MVPVDLPSIVAFLQCTTELLQAYYVNLARSHSGGAFQVAEPPAPVATSSEPSSSSSVTSSSSSQRNVEDSVEMSSHGRSGGSNEEEPSPHTTSSSSAAGSSAIIDDEAEVGLSPSKLRGAQPDNMAMDVPSGYPIQRKSSNRQRGEAHLAPAPSSDHERHKDENISVPVPVPIPLRHKSSTNSHRSYRSNASSNPHSPSIAFPTSSTLPASLPNTTLSASPSHSPQRKRARPLSLSRNVSLGGVILDLDGDRDGRRRKVEVPIESSPPIPVTTPTLAANTAEAAG